MEPTDPNFLVQKPKKERTPAQRAATKNAFEKLKEKREAMKQEQVEEEVVEEEVVVEEEQSLEEFEYKGVRYCKDSENNVYGLDDDDTPSEQPIGHWSQKQQAIMFYKTK